MSEAVEICGYEDDGVMITNAPWEVIEECCEECADIEEDKIYQIEYAIQEKGYEAEWFWHS